MIKNLTPNQILLIAMATALFLLSAFSFYLLQDLSAPLPFAPPPPTSTVTPRLPSSTSTSSPSYTSEPTRQTSYTPFATPGTTTPSTPEEEPGTPQSVTPGPSGTTSPRSPTNTSSFQTPSTSPPTLTPTPATATVTPTASQTLTAGEYGVTGRVIQNGTPVANAIVEFSDDDPSRQATTNPGGHYWFITLAPGTTFTLAFSQVDNPRLTPVPEIASLAWIEGTLPTGVDIIDLPDLEVSLNLDGVRFELQAPADGASYSAATISPSNPIQFIWTPYNLGESYYIVLGANGSEDALWISSDTTTTNLMWNGTLDDGSHISEGAYWWRVAVKNSLGNYKLIAFTQEWDLLFNP